MFEFTRQEAVLAAEQFCCGLYEWTSSFTGSPNGVSFERDLFVGDKYDNSLIAENNFIGGDFTQNIKLIFDFAETGTWNGVNIFHDQHILEDQLGEVLTPLAAFDEIFSKDLNFQDFLEVKIGSHTIIEILRGVVNAAFARYYLMVGHLSLDEIALLADVSLKTVQNAVSTKSKDRLVVSSSTAHKGKSTIESQEARRWLQTKKGFTGPYFIDDMPTYDEYQTLGQLQHHCLSLIQHSNQSLDSIQSKLSWTDEAMEAFMALTKLQVSDTLKLLTPAFIKQFGELCNLGHIEKFVTEASKIIASTVAEYQSASLFKA